MRIRVAERALARRLRAEGYSYSEIRQQIGDIPKGTLNYWLRDIALSAEQRRRLLEKVQSAAERGRQRGALANRGWREERLKRAQLFARQTFEIQLAHPLFAMGLILYACEGAKTSNLFAFVNSDPSLVELMVRWLTEVCCVPEERIHARVYTHRIYEDKDCLSYWRRVTGLPEARFGKTVYKPTPHTEKKNPSFMGCCRLVVHKVDFFFVVMAWQKLLVERLLGSPPRTAARQHIWEAVVQITSSTPRKAPFS